MLLLGRTRFLFFTFLVIVLGGIFAYLKQNSPLLFLGSRSEAACQGDVSKISFKIHPHFYLNKKFLPAISLSDDELRAYIEKHIRYIYLAMPAFEKQKTPKFSVIPFGGLQISQIVQKDASYPLALKTSWAGVNPYFLKAMNERQDVDSLYMKKAVAAGQTATTDEAILVSYEADVELLMCENEQRRFASEVALPTDPFLGFWFVPENKRIQKFNEVTKTNESITPCANDEFLYDQDPYYYWHYYSLDENSCKESLLPKAVQSFKIESKSLLSTQTKTPFDLKFLDQVRDRELKMTVNFTRIDDDSPEVKSFFDTGLPAKVNAIIANPSFNEAKTLIGQLNEYDLALHSGLIFAWSLKSLSDNFEFKQVALNNQLLQWNLRGQLKKSHQKYNVVVTMGSAITESDSYSGFYASLNQGIAASDIVYFGGHSGVGKNLSENRIQEQVTNLYSSLNPAEIPSHQLMILMTCYSLHYFPKDGFPKPNKDFVRDILYTASVPAGYDARILVGLVEQVDNYLAKGSQLPLEKWPSHYDRDVFLVHQRDQK
jgi:hypothetical protein